ncbi:Ca2+-binding RTX toxin-like protein [Microvirga lupini]|uniref:Ca2+-binding RTX toxin-like protein n=1 Tax=Microvirga lupini TaxID=420324 RepID=A0A7W4VI20_9HYPH|nr:hypothetical protein [Microvirga lupini]MBB3017578.1 Ca2+-binding RTX toxin-like protein [Microvirga lupini]
MARIVGSGLANILNGTSLGDLLQGLGGNDTLRGLRGTDVLEGGAGHDKLFGGLGNDLLRGGRGDDRLVGDAGNDQLNGNEGRDILTGGAGRDTFIFKHARETRPGSSADVVTDFTRQDTLHLKNIDAVKNVAGNQDFTFIGNSGFSGHAGELNYRFIGSGAQAKTIVAGDQNGDGNADFEIILLKHIAISKANIFGDL